MKQYKHIFDYFDEDGKYIGGCEPLSSSTEKPTGLNHSCYSIPDYVVYVGWCEENENVYTGCCFPEIVKRNSKTKQLTRIYEEITNSAGLVVKTPKCISNVDSKMNLEMICKITGIELPEKYVLHKKEVEDLFNTEYEKVVNNKEYFREKYYN